MKKIAKVCAVLSLCVGFTFSLAALSACGDDAMIDGDFTTEATAEQVTEVREYLSEASYDTALGDTSSEDWSYNARFYADGNIDFSISATGTENSVPVNYMLSADTDVRFDHIMTLYGTPESPFARKRRNVLRPLVCNDGSHVVFVRCRYRNPTVRRLLL